MSWVDDLFASFERYDQPDEDNPSPDESNGASGRSGGKRGDLSSEPAAGGWPDESRHTWSAPSGEAAWDTGGQPNIDYQAWYDYARQLAGGEWPDESVRAAQRPGYEDPGSIELPRREANEFGIPQLGGNGGGELETGWLRNRQPPAPPLLDPGLQAWYEWGVQQGVLPPPDRGSGAAGSSGFGGPEPDPWAGLKGLWSGWPWEHSATATPAPSATTTQPYTPTRTPPATGTPTLTPSRTVTPTPWPTVRRTPAPSPDDDTLTKMTKIIMVEAGTGKYFAPTDEQKAREAVQAVAWTMRNRREAGEALINDRGTPYRGNPASDYEKVFNAYDAYRIGNGAYHAPKVSEKVKQWVKEVFQADPRSDPTKGATFILDQQRYDALRSAGMTQTPVYSREWETTGHVPAAVHVFQYQPLAPTRTPTSKTGRRTP